MTRTWTFVSAILIGLALAIGGGWWLMNRNYQFQGVVIDPPVPAADFSLTDQNGQVFRLSEQRGKLVLIFFGYTHCPDVCPLTLSEYKQIKKSISAHAGEAVAQQVVYVFITVDPERDTPAQMAAYMANFDPSFYGLSSDLDTLTAVWQAYGVYQQKQTGTSAAGYLVDHSSRMYLINTQGNWQITYPFGMEAEKISADLLHLLER